MPNLYTGNLEALLPYLFRQGFYSGRERSWNNLLQAEEARIQQEQLGMMKKQQDWQNFFNTITAISQVTGMAKGYPQAKEGLGEMFGDIGGIFKSGGLETAGSTPTPFSGYGAFLQGQEPQTGYGQFLQNQQPATPGIAPGTPMF